MIANMYKSKKQLLQSDLMKAEWVSITLDMWSYRRMRFFMGITVHFIVDTLQRKSYLLNFSKFNANHIADNIADHCIVALDQNGIRHKVCFIITDNAANMIAAFRDSMSVFSVQDDESSIRIIDESESNDALVDDENKAQPSTDHSNEVRSAQDEMKEQIDGIISCSEYDATVKLISKSRLFPI